MQVIPRPDSAVSGKFTSAAAKLPNLLQGVKLMKIEGHVHYYLHCEWRQGTISRFIRVIDSIIKLHAKNEDNVYRRLHEFLSLH